MKLQLKIEIKLMDLGEVGWDDAFKHSELLGKNWRLPTIGELMVIYESGMIKSKDSYWSDSQNMKDYVWAIDFDGGRIFNYLKSFGNHVIVVR